jgi:hypothetical protein
MTPRPVQPTGGGVKCGSVRVAIFNRQTVLPLSRARRRTVKPFNQRELQRYRHHYSNDTVTICLKLKISNQIVTQK